jgi:hypothetical protein
MSAAKRDKLINTKATSSHAGHEAEFELDENELLGEEPHDCDPTKGQGDVVKTPPDPIYDIMKQMQDSMNNMASSMEKLSQQQTQHEIPPRRSKGSVGKATTEAKKRKNVVEDELNTVSKRNKRSSDLESGEEVSDDEASEPELEASTSSGDDAELLIGAKMAASRSKNDNADSAKAHDTATHAKVLDEIEQEYENSATGPNVEAHVAKTINKRWAARMDISILKDKMAKYNRPDNCEMIRVPRVNTPVWKTLEPYQRRQDVKITNIQKTCAAVGSSLAYTLDMVCKDQNKDLDTSQLIRHVADAAAMLGHINTDLSLLRRELMRPKLHTDYRNLCNPDHPVTSLLFGDDLQKEMKDLKETSLIGSKVSSAYRSYHDGQSSLQTPKQGSRSYNSYRPRDFFRGGRQKARNRKKYHFKKEMGQN